MFGNWVKTFVLMAVITALFGAVGGAMGGATGMIMALCLAGAMNFYAYWFSDKAVLKMYGAQEITPDNQQFSSKGIGLRIFHHIHFWHGQLCILRQLFYHAVIATKLLIIRRNFLRAIHF